MELKSGYKQTEVGVIPEDWDLKKVGDHFEFKNGLNKAKSYFGRGTPIVNYMDVFSNTGITYQCIEGLVTLTPEETRNYSAKKGDVFFTRTSETLEEIGMASVLLDDIPNASFSGFVLRGRPTDNSFSKRYCKYCFRTPEVRKQITSKGSYTTRALTNGRALATVRVPLPPTKAEQEAIAEALSEADALIASLEQLIAKKRCIKQGAMQELLPGKRRLPGFSGDWEEKTLGEHVSFLKTGAYSRSQLTESGQTKYLHYGDIHTSASLFLSPSTTMMPYLPDSYAKTLDKLQDGDLVFADASEDKDGVGKSIEIKSIGRSDLVSGLHTIAARFDKSVLADGFKAYLQFCRPFQKQLRRLAAGTKVYATTRTHIGSVEMKLPNTEEQTAIATVLSEMDTEIDALETKLSKARLLKQGMMQELLTGRIRLV